MHMCIALGLLSKPWSESDPRTNVVFTFRKSSDAVCRRFPIRRGKLRVINSLWRVAVGNESAHRVAPRRGIHLKLACCPPDETRGRVTRAQAHFGGSYFCERY